MKNFFTILALTTAINFYSQKADTIKLSDFKLCELTIDFLKEKDPDLRQIEVEEKDLCADGFVTDRRYQNSIGYKSALYPGVIFQKYESDNNKVAKIHLTQEFKGFLPDGNYVDLKFLKAENILKKYDSLNSWTSKGCSDYWGIKKNEELNFYVKIVKDKAPRYPVDVKYYSEQLIAGIDIISDCYAYDQKLQINPLFIVEGKEVSEQYIKDLKPEEVDSITVLKEKSAVDKYGLKGKNGVVEIVLKKK